MTAREELIERLMGLKPEQLNTVIAWMEKERREQREDAHIPDR